MALSIIIGFVAALCVALIADRLAKKQINRVASLRIVEAKAGNLDENWSPEYYRLPRDGELANYILEHTSLFNSEDRFITGRVSGHSQTIFDAPLLGKEGNAKLVEGSDFIADSLIPLHKVEEDDIILLTSEGKGGQTRYKLRCFEKFIEEKNVIQIISKKYDKIQNEHKESNHKIKDYKAKVVGIIPPPDSDRAQAEPQADSNDAISASIDNEQVSVGSIQNS